MYRKILVGLDGSDTARHALDHALALARQDGAEVYALAVEEQLPAYAATVGEMDEEKRFKNGFFRTVQADAESAAAKVGVPLTFELGCGNASLALVTAAERGGFDLIVLGRSGHSRLHHLFMGATADRVAERAPCAVLIVPPAAVAS